MENQNSVRQYNYRLVPNYVGANLAQPNVHPTDHFLFHIHVLLGPLPNNRFTTLIRRDEQLNSQFFHGYGASLIRQILASDPRIPDDILSVIPQRVFSDIVSLYGFDDGLPC
ncbi:hypothetical protein QL285_016262 [Trifolium repens]|nr:hypothetical protein QL285_016262 [Trifolium repens]